METNSYVSVDTVWCTYAQAQHCKYSWSTLPSYDFHSNGAQAITGEQGCTSVTQTLVGFNWSLIELSGAVHTMWLQCDTQLSRGKPKEQNRGGPLHTQTAVADLENPQVKQKNYEA